MKEPNLGNMAYDLLHTATSLSGILDQTMEGNCIRVNFQFAASLIRDVQELAVVAADELMFIHTEREFEQRKEVENGRS